MATLLRPFALLSVLLAATFVARSASAQSDLGPPGSSPPTLVGDSPSTTSPTPDNRYHVMLVDGSHLIGTLQMGKEISLTSTVGDVSLPVEKIAALRFTDRPNCRVEFENGDRLSGSLALMTIKVKTIWGVAEIELEHIALIVSQSQYQQYEMQPAYAGGWEQAAPYANGTGPYDTSGSYVEPAPTYPAPPPELPSPSSSPPAPFPVPSYDSR